VLAWAKPTVAALLAAEFSRVKRFRNFDVTRKRRAPFEFGLPCKSGALANPAIKASFS
jgi:hypothetical protein